MSSVPHEIAQEGADPVPFRHKEGERGGEEWEKRGKGKEERVWSIVSSPVVFMYVRALSTQFLFLDMKMTTKGSAEGCNGSMLIRLHTSQNLASTLLLLERTRSAGDRGGLCQCKFCSRFCSDVKSTLNTSELPASDLHNDVGS
jgi:hypothetical protein